MKEIDIQERSILNVRKPNVSIDKTNSFLSK